MKPSISLLVWIRLRKLLCRKISDSSRPVVDTCGGCLVLWRLHYLRRSTRPLWARRGTKVILVRLWVDVLRHWCIVLIGPRGVATTKQLQS